MRRFTLFDCGHGPLIAQLRADLATAEVALVAERARYDVLLQTVLAMKANGAAVVAKAGSAVEANDLVVIPEKSDDMEALIDAQCGRDYRKRAMMLAQLKKDRAAGLSDEKIEAAILHGIQSEGVPS